MADLLVLKVWSYITGASWVGFLLVFSVCALHVHLSPYTKVEESFNLHAIHDVLRYGISGARHHLWDHRTFPGAVPRSFLPAVLTGLMAKPLLVLYNLLEIFTTSVDVQVVVRVMLAGVFAFACANLIQTISRKMGRATSAWFAIWTLAQFHIPYYAGRTLPNFMALPWFVLGISFILLREEFFGILFMTATATVMRLEIAAFVVPTAIQLVLQKRTSLFNALLAGAIGGFGSLLFSAPLDYWLWAPTLPHDQLPGFTPLKTLWPEFSAMLFNIVDGQADNWGVMPKHFYAVALAKSLAGALPLALFGLFWAAVQAVTGKTRGVLGNRAQMRNVGEIARTLLPGTVCLILALSTVGHKEWRFIVYAYPVLNIVAAITSTALWYIPHKGLRFLARLGTLGLLAGTIALTLVSTYVSMHNYPGGEVHKELEGLGIPKNSTIHFHSGALQTGASLFTFTHADFPSAWAFPKPLEPTWTYSKDEDEALLDPESAWEAGLDCVVTPDFQKFVQAQRHGHERMWSLVGGIKGVAGVGRGGKYGVEVKWRPELGILKRERATCDH